MSGVFSEATVHTEDGLRLYVRDYDTAPPGRLPVVCLPGLTRNHRDFAALAERLAGTRRVICPDMRGRGNSDRDPDPVNYNVLRETQDIAHILDTLRVARAAFVGSSRGGLQIMVLAVLRPEMIAAAVLNDVGPRLEKRGLVRIVATLGLTKDSYPDWEAATAAVRQSNLTQFPGLGEAEWRAMARCLMAEVDGTPRPDYDWHIAHAARMATDEGPPELWPQFLALEGRPVLAIRGALSDILSADTLAEMHRLMPGLRSVTLPDRGHVPFLDEPLAVAAIEALLEEADQPCSPTSSPSEPPPGA